MVFASPIFLFLFLPITLLGYYLIHPKFRNFWLFLMYKNTLHSLMLLLKLM